MGKEATAKNPSLICDRAQSAHIAKIFVVCDQKDIVPVWGDTLCQKGLSNIFEPSIENTIDHRSIEMADLVVLDLDIDHDERMELYQKFQFQPWESLAHVR